jgi:hypothetical protein
MRRTWIVAAALGWLLAAADRAPAATPVSYPELLRQVRSGPLIRAIINRTRHDIEIKFRDLSEWEAPYPPGAQTELQRLLRRRHVRVIFAARPGVKHTRHAAVHHRLRYIAAGVLGALALIGLASYLYLKRRRPRAAHGGAAAP